MEKGLPGVSTFPSSTAPVLTRFLSARHNMETTALRGSTCPAAWHLFSSASCLLGTTWSRRLSGVSTFPSYIASVFTRFLPAGQNMEYETLLDKHLIQFHDSCYRKLSPATCPSVTVWRRRIFIRKNVQSKPLETYKTKLKCKILKALSNYSILKLI
jgi:hypothetical protein